MFATNECLRAGTVTAILIGCLALGACSEKTNREDFATLTKGKTQDQVLSSAGKPALRSDTADGRPVWTYTSRTFDIQNQNKFDAKTRVIFGFNPAVQGQLIVSEVVYE